MKKIIALIVCVIMIFSLVACDNNQSTDPSETEANKVVDLSMRQKRILIMQGLPADYDLLTEKQQKAIVEIEELLRHAEDKYGYPCEYVWYTNEFTENGVLTCTTSEGDAAGYEFCVYKDLETIKDTYIYAACTPVYTKQVEGYLKQNYPDVTVKIYTLVYGSGNITLPVTAEQLSRNIMAECWVMIDSETCNEERMHEVIETMKTWQTENAYAGTITVSLMAEGVVKQLTQYNYAAYLDSEYEMAKETCDVLLEENE